MSPARRSKWEEFYGLVADLAGTYRAIWAVLAVVLGVAFVPAVLIRELSEPGSAPFAEPGSRPCLSRS
jgi:hypothetical protein